MRSCWTAAPITAEGPRKGEPSTRIVRYGLRTQTREISPRQLPTNHVPAVPTRAYQCDQSSRQLLGRYRLCCPVGSSRLTSRNLFPPSRPAKTSEVPQRCSPARVRFAPVGPLPAPRRSGPSNSRDGRLRRERLPYSVRQKRLDRPPPYQFSEARSAESITRTSTGSFLGSKFNPSCS